MTIIKVKTIPEARAAAIDRLLSCGYRVAIQRGSFAGQAYRIQLPYLMLTVSGHLFDRVPVPPPADWPVEMTAEHGEAYYNRYILGSTGPAENEAYTYASRLNENGQLEKIMEMLRETPQTNQAVFSIGRPEDVDLADPACWRGGHFVFDGDLLHLHVWFRSHDVYAGMPENFYGISRLLEDVAEYAGLECGHLLYYGSGSHLYSYQLGAL